MKWRVKFHGARLDETVEADRIYLSPSGALQFLSKVTKAESEEAEKPVTKARFVKGVGFRRFKGADVGNLISVRGFNADQWRDYTLEAD